jgi:hypothetical protein
MKRLNNLEPYKALCNLPATPLAKVPKHIRQQPVNHHSKHTLHLTKTFVIHILSLLLARCELLFAPKLPRPVKKSHFQKMEGELEATNELPPTTGLFYDVRQLNHVNLFDSEHPEHPGIHILA